MATEAQLDLFDPKRPPSAPATWPSEGITSAGAWGSYDGRTWEKVLPPAQLVCGGASGFTMGYLVNSPNEARRIMWECLREAGENQR